MNSRNNIITSEITRTILKGFFISIDNKDPNTFYSLNSFLYKRLTDCYLKDDFNGYVEFSAFFVYYYEYALKKINSSITYKDIYEACADRSARGLKEKLKTFEYTRTQESTNEIIGNQNKYSKVILNRFSELIYTCLQYQDISHLSFLLNQLSQTASLHDYRANSLKFEILLSRNKVVSTDERLSLDEKKELYSALIYVDSVVRSLFKITLFWSIFLYEKNILSADALIQIFDIFDNHKALIEGEFLNDLLVLRDESLGRDFSWNHWDYMKRPEGVVYSPPTLSNWVSFGATVYLLKDNLRLGGEIENNHADKINSIDFLISSLHGILASFSEESSAKWLTVLKLDKVLFNQSVQTLRSKIENLSSQARRLRRKLIVSEPISESIVTNFKTTMEDGWRKSNTFEGLFTYFKNLTNYAFDTPEGQFSMIGFRGQLLEGLKAHLIDHPSFNAPVFGIERFGTQVEEQEELYIIRRILKPKQVEATNNIVQKIEDCLASLRQNDMNPSVILIGLNLWHQTFHTNLLPDFNIDREAGENFPYPNFAGAYKQIPIIRLNSPVMNDLVIVTDFEKSFQLNRRLVENSSDQVLNLSIIEVSQNEANKIYGVNPLYWPNSSKDDVVTELMTGVIIDFYLWEDLVVKDFNAYSVISFSPSEASNVL